VLSVIKNASTVKTLLIVGMSAQAVAINIDHEKDETDRASSLRGFKPDYIEKLYWTEHHESGYHHWNNGRDKSDRNNAASDYSLTVKELLDTALASRNATAIATQLAEASAANDYDAVREAVGNLNSAAYLLKVNQFWLVRFCLQKKRKTKKKRSTLKICSRILAMLKGLQMLLVKQQS